MTTLKELADELGTDVDTLKEMNPEDFPEDIDEDATISDDAIATTREAWEVQNRNDNG